MGRCLAIVRFMSFIRLSNLDLIAHWWIINAYGKYWVDRRDMEMILSRAIGYG